jgi:hypothetical protein
LLPQVTLFTRGKTPIAQQIPDDTDASFKAYESKIKHIKGNRQARPRRAVRIHPAHVLLARVCCVARVWRTHGARCALRPASPCAVPPSWRYADVTRMRIPSLARCVCQEPESVKALLKGQKFDAVYDLNGTTPHTHAAPRTHNTQHAARICARTR